MSPIAAAVLRSVVLPAVLVGLGLVGLGRAGRRRASIQTSVLALGFVLGSYLLLFHLNVPPADVNESFSFAALLLAAFAGAGPRATGPRYVARAVTTLALVALVLYHIAPSLGGPVNLRNLAAFYCLCLGLWSITETSAARTGAPAVLVSAFIATLAVAAVTMIGGSAVFSQQAGILAGGLGAALAVAVVLPKRFDALGTAPFAAAMVGLIATTAHFYLDVNPWHLILCCFPFGLLAVRRRLPLPKHPLAEAATIALLSAVPLGLFLKHLFESAGPLYSHQLKWRGRSERDHPARTTALARDGSRRPSAVGLGPQPTMDFNLKDGFQI